MCRVETNRKCSGSPPHTAWAVVPVFLRGVGLSSILQLVKVRDAEQVSTCLHVCWGLPQWMVASLLTGVCAPTGDSLVLMGLSNVHLCIDRDNAVIGRNALMIRTGAVFWYWTPMLVLDCP